MCVVNNTNCNLNQSNKIVPPPEKKHTQFAFET